MGLEVARILYGSDNYGLNLENSDKDYKIIEVPSFIDLWYNKTLNRQIDDNTSAWDIREFVKFLLKANPNAIELLFSVSQKFEDEELEHIFYYAKENIGALIRNNWKIFVNAIFGLATHCVLRNGEDAKGFARGCFFFKLFETAYMKNGNLTSSDWRNDYSCWLKALRKEDNIETLAVNYYQMKVDFCKKDWTLTPTEEDKTTCTILETMFQDYFIHRLTNN